MPLAKIPNFYCAVAGTADKVAAVWVESYARDTFIVCVIVLN